MNPSGADVYRIDLQNRLRRLDLEKIAQIHLSKDIISKIDGITLSDEETADMRNWQKRRQDQLELRRQNDINRLVEAMNQAADWVQNEASAKQLENIQDQVLMAMHDLRATMVRKMAQVKTTG